MAGHDSETGDTAAPAADHEIGQEMQHGASGHRHEQPEDWGWHANLGGLARFGGVFSLIALALMLSATQYNRAGTLALVLCMLGIVGGLIWDFQQRRNSWRR